MDGRVQTILNDIRDCCIAIFGDNLTGVYVHGSLAFGCFTWEKSDIDFIVLVKSAPNLEQKKAFINELLRIDKNGAAQGLEMSVVLEKYAREFVYPTPFELHFSNMHKQRYIDNLDEYCRTMNGTDKDLAAHFTVIRNVCITIYGMPEKEVFGEVPSADYLDSIEYDIENAKEDIKSNSMYTVLTLCRVLAYIRDGLVVSKEGGGRWGMANLPEQYKGMVCDALKCYKNEGEFHADTELLEDYAKYMRGLIFGKQTTY